ncbi:MAG: UDP-3-O-(3-hydroxymyristoyl) glucosamine N-acyltransferase [Sulfuricurvum sp. PC08-66]|nr:MAG: UDP-3-O-(3-hydroxymyristoyl) glucosamine N-acyltransferase [Sulfuricurvum sp. PC08-66]
MRLSHLVVALELEYSGKEVEISGLNALGEATDSELSFLENAKYAKALASTKAAAVFVHPKNAHLVPDGCIALLTPTPYLHLAYATKLFAPPLIETQGHEAVIGEGATLMPHVHLGKNVTIGAGATLMAGVFIGDNVTIGEGAILYPNVVVYRDCHVGARTIIHASSVIGSDGFGFAHTAEGEHIKIYQNGNVIIEEDVEIGSNVSIDRAVFGSTRIGRGTKIDNLIQIGHNCRIDEHVIIVAHSALAGSTHVGHHTVMGGQTGTAGHLSIAPFSTLYARTGVTNDITIPKESWAGFPHMPHREWLKMSAKIRMLTKRTKESQ